jgi:predicted GNAT family N-acyltransferase
MTSKLTFTTQIQAPPGPSLSYPEPSSSPWPRVFADAFSVRKTIFCDEQYCSLDNELDEDDHRSWHWVAYAEEGETKVPVGVIRLVPPPHGAHPTPVEGSVPATNKRGHVGDEKTQGEEEPYIKLTRLALLPEYRRHGLGRVLVSTALDWASEHAEELSSALEGDEKWTGSVLIHAQVSVEKAWGKMGFATDEGLGRWDEEGIMHLGMWKRVEIE